MNRLRILSINVRRLGSAGKSVKIVQELNYLNCDVILSQETHVSCKKQAEKFEKLWKGKCFWSFGTGKSAGVAVIFPPNFSGNVIRFLFDSNGRILSLLIDFHNLFFSIVNIYSPTVVSDSKIFSLTCKIIFFRKAFCLSVVISILLIMFLTSLIVLLSPLRTKLLLSR